MNTKKYTSFKFDKEFVSCVRYYMTDREKNLSKIHALFRVFRDEDLCRIEDSPRVLEFKRHILAIVAKWQRTAIHDYLVWDSIYADDNCACNAVSEIERYIADCWNCGATVNFNGMY